MNLIQSVTLGIVQGITEWLPISSNAHLKIVPELLHSQDPGTPAVAVMQLGTMAAVIIYFWKDIASTLAGMVKAWSPGGDRNSPEARLALAVLVGTIPICIAGILLKKLIFGVFRGDYVIAGALIIGGILLLLAEKFAKLERPLSGVTVWDGLIVGIAQTFALVPGVSRSGSTLIGSFLTGLNREAAIRFSFLLSIPAVLLSGLYELKDVYSYYVKHEPLPTEFGPIMEWTPTDLIVATVVAGIVGYATIAFLLKYLAKHSTLVFVIYRILLALVLIYLFSTGRNRTPDRAMMPTPLVPEFAWWQWAALFFAAFTIGLAKTGVAGVGIIAVGLFPLVIPAREATGNVLLLLISADILAVITYKREAEWRYLWKIFPWAAVGVVLGFLVMGRVNDAVLARIIGGILLALAALQIFQKTRPKKAGEEDALPASPLLSSGAGIVAGFTTMVANAAGPVMILYLLTMRLPKLAFIGTAAWFFFAINLFKVPFSVAAGGIKPSGLVLAVLLYPGALVGGLVGRALLPKIDQRVFEWLALLFTVAAGIKLVL